MTGFPIFHGRLRCPFYTTPIPKHGPNKGLIKAYLHLSKEPTNLDAGKAHSVNVAGSGSNSKFSLILDGFRVQGVVEGFRVQGRSLV